MTPVQLTTAGGKISINGQFFVKATVKLRIGQTDFVGTVASTSTATKLDVTLPALSNGKGTLAVTNGDKQSSNDVAFKVQFESISYKKHNGMDVPMASTWAGIGRLDSDDAVFAMQNGKLSAYKVSNFMQLAFGVAPSPVLAVPTGISGDTQPIAYTADFIRGGAALISCYVTGLATGGCSGTVLKSNSGLPAAIAAKGTGSKYLIAAAYSAQVQAWSAIDTDPRTLPVSAATAVAVADLDGTGNLDVAVLSGQTVTVFKQSKAYQPEPGLSLAGAALDPKVLAIADVNGDQSPDFIGWDSTQKHLLFFNSDGTSFTPQAAAFPSFDTVAAITVWDAPNSISMKQAVLVVAHDNVASLFVSGSN